MENLKKIYLVSSGEYSSYQINGVFSTRELAEQWIGEITNITNRFQIEERDLDDTSNPPRESRWVTLNVEDGNVIGWPRVSIGYGTPMSIIYDPWCTPPELHVEVFTSSNARAIKVANEKRFQLIALGRIPTDDLTRFDFTTLNKK